MLELLIIIILFSILVKKSMTICNIFYSFVKKSILFEIKKEGLKMKMVVKNAKSLFERFENSLERLAEILF